MSLLRASLLAPFLLALARPAHAEPAAATASSGPGFGERFFRGTSPGELPAPKVFVVTTLYAASIASLTVGITMLVRAGNQGDDADAFKLDQPAGFCNDLVSEECLRYRSLLDEQSETRTAGLALLGASGLALLGGALTAELWPNDKSVPGVAFRFDGTKAGITAFGTF